jgi:hypothetical protein
VIGSAEFHRYEDPRLTALHQQRHLLVARMNSVA